MAKKKSQTEEDEMSAEPAPEAPPKKLSTLQKVKLANQLIEAVESKAIRDAFLNLPQGEAIHKIFVDAAEKHVETLMGNEALEEDLSLAQQKVDEIVTSCVKLQQALIQSVRQVVGGGQQRPQQPAQQQQPQAKRPQQAPAPQQAVRAIRKQPIYEEVQLPDSEDDALLY